MTTSRRLGALFVAGLVAASACSFREDPPATPPAPDSRLGGTLPVEIGPPASVDPGNAYDENSALVASALCDTLVHADPATGELRPAIATAWVVTDEGRRLVVRLRDDVTMHDGRRLTADDVVWSLSRLASAAYASNAARLLQPVAGFAEVHGERATDDERLRDRLAGVRVLDELSFEISLSEPRADFVRVLAEPATAPVSRHAAERDPNGFERRPACAGPYRLASDWSPGAKTIRLERFDGYYGRAAAYSNGGRGYVDAIEFRVGGAGAKAGDALARGSTGGVPAPTRSVEYVGLPAGVKPFDDPRVRRALALGLDRSRLAVGPLRDALPATGFASPAVPGATGCADALPPRGDVPRATALLAEAGISLRGVPLPLYVNDDYGLPAVAGEVARQWRAAFGLDVRVVKLPWHEYLAKGTSAAGFDGAFRYSWVPDHGSLDAVLHPLAASAGVGRTNLSRFSDPRVDRALEREARQAVDGADRAVAYQRVATLACEYMPLVPVAVRVVTWRPPANGRATDGRFLDRTTARPLLREMWLAQLP